MKENEKDGFIQPPSDYSNFIEGTLLFTNIHLIQIRQGLFKQKDITKIFLL